MGTRQKQKKRRENNVYNVIKYEFFPKMFTLSLFVSSSPTPIENMYGIVSVYIYYIVYFNYCNVKSLS